MATNDRIEMQSFTVRLPVELIRQLDIFRYKRMYPSKQAAMEALMRAGLKANPPKPEDAK